MDTQAIERRYDALAADTCCLSCGGAAERAQPKAGETCLDLGSGRGTDALRMAQAVGPTGFVWGVDIADGMLDRARATAKKLGTSNVRFEKALLEDLPIESDSLDLVVSNCVLNHAADKLQVWRETFRVLKPGGRFFVSDIYSSLPVPESFRSDPQAVAECWAGADTRATYLSHVSEAGLVEVQILEESAPYQKGQIEVSSFTLRGVKPKPRCCCRS